MTEVDIHKKKAKPALKVSGKRSVSRAHAETEKQNFGQAKKGALFLLGVIVAYICYLVFSGQMNSFIESLRGVNRSWVVAAALCYIAYYSCGVMAYLIAVVADPGSKLGVRDLMSVEATGIFFNNLTPNGAGAAPAQLIRLMRSGLSVGAAGALQYTRFIIYEASEGIFAAIMLIFRLNYFIETYGNVYLIGVFLFGFKVVEVGFWLIVSLKPRWVIKIGNWVIRLCERHGWMKDPKHWYEVVNTQVMEFSRGFTRAAKNVTEMLLTLLITLLQLGFQYALPWFVLKAFGKPADLLTCLAAGSMLELLTSAIPLPGGTGGAEGGFAFLFKPMFGEATSAGFVVWRMVEYFLPILATVPLLGIQSNSGYSVRERYMRMKRGKKRPGFVKHKTTYATGFKKKKQPRYKTGVSTGGIKVNLSKVGKKQPSSGSNHQEKQVKKISE